MTSRALLAVVVPLLLCAGVVALRELRYQPRPASSSD